MKSKERRLLLLKGTLQLEDETHIFFNKCITYKTQFLVIPWRLVQTHKQCIHFLKCIFEKFKTFMLESKDLVIMGCNKIRAGSV